MPEGDTVYLSAARLHAALKGRRLTRSDLRVPRYATTDLSGQTVREVIPIGKHILFRIEGGITLHTHFKMEGRWDVYEPGKRWRGPAFKVRAVLETPEAIAVGVDLAAVDLKPTRQEDELVGHLGPDLLAPVGKWSDRGRVQPGWGGSAPRLNLWDEDEALARLRADGSVDIGDALIDQTKMAGLGNVNRSEICFLKGLHPFTPVAAVDDLKGLVDLARRVIMANRTTGNQVTTGDKRPGRSHWVYGRRGEPCRRCGTPIVKTYSRAAETNGTPDRVVYLCPWCQPPPGGAGDITPAPLP
jgi:endonuclease-8